MIKSPSANLPLSVEQCDLIKVLAHTYLQQNLAEKAVVLLHAIYCACPTDAVNRTSLAFAYLRCGRPHEAMLLLDRFDADGLTRPEIHLLRSQAYNQMGRMVDAAASMRHYIGACRMTESRGEG